MQETTQQYVARIEGYVKGKNHLKVLRLTPEKIGRLIRRASGARLTKKGDSGKWSVAEILAHLAESEIVFGYRMRLVLGSNGTQIQAFDQNKWQSNARYLNRKPKQAFELFRSLRKNNLDLLKSLSKEQWDCYGIHQERGEESIGRMVELYAGHDVNHLQQIAILVKGRQT